MASNISLKGLGTEQLTVSTASIGFAAIPDNAHRAYMRVVDANLFFENDGSTVTTSLGTQVDNGSFIDLTDARYDLADWRFIRAAATDAVIHISYFN